MSQTIFYSWQSDTKAACNRSLIQSALEAAVTELRGVGTPLVDVAVDRDTLGEPGSPDIASTILDKIDRCSVFVADVTLIDGGATSRRSPNPNVLLELGYAIKAKSFSRVIMVMNTSFGRAEDLPFDIRGKRILTYESAPDAEERAVTRKALSRTLLQTLVGAIQPETDALISSASGQEIDVSAIRVEIEELLLHDSSRVTERLFDIFSRLEASASLAPGDFVMLLEVALSLGSKYRRVDDVDLLKISDWAIAKQPSAPTYFYRGVIFGRMGLPYDSIASYMKAVSLGDSNPSLCYLNAGNRYRDLNDTSIAISFYKKAVSVNPDQADAWLAAAQLEQQEGLHEDAAASYTGFLRWFEKLPDQLKQDPRRQQQAEVAKAFIEGR